MRTISILVFWLLSGFAFGENLAKLTVKPGNEIDFGNRPMGSYATVTYVIKNSGRAVATSLAITPGIPTNLTVTRIRNSCGYYLTVGRSCSYEVRFQVKQLGFSQQAFSLRYFNQSQWVTEPLTLKGSAISPSPVLMTLAPNSGSDVGGTLVTISGESLGSDSVVLLGGTACAQLTVSSLNQIQCVTPRHAPGLVDVSVTNSLGKVSTLKSAFRYQGAPTVSAIYPTTGLSEGGSRVTLSGAEFQLGFEVFIDSRACTNPRYQGRDRVSCDAPAHPPGLASVVLKNPDGRQGALNNVFRYMGGWTWRTGSSSLNEPSQKTPSARESVQSWKKSDGDLVLFGGEGFQTDSETKVYLDDFWKWSGGKWERLSGPVPPARKRGQTWTDFSDRLWLFGGETLAGQLNDLWVYENDVWSQRSADTALNRKGIYGTLGVSSATTYPGSRSGAVTWRDSNGNLRLFGGRGYDAGGTLGELNDLWVFDGLQWTWVDGSSTVGSAGVYTGATVRPGGRYDAVSFVDKNQSLWLLGGYGRDRLGRAGYLSDMWNWNGTRWAFIKGSDAVNQAPIFPALGNGSTAARPGSRAASSGWVDAFGNFWVLGGYGSDRSGRLGYLNDLWKWDGSRWSWIAGSQTAEAATYYGVQGTTGTFAHPGARARCTAWTDEQDRLWLFGGYGRAGDGGLGTYNESWTFEE